VTEAFAAGVFPRELMHGLGALGAIGASIVGRDGRPAATRAATFAIMHALEWGDAGLRLAVTIQDSVIHALARYGDDAQRARWIDPLVRGEAVASFALTERDAGSDLRALSTRAVRRGPDWILTGRKTWVTNATIADVLLVWARTGERNEAIRGFLVERGAVGLDTPERRGRTSLRAGSIGEIVLDRTCVPADAVIPHAWGLQDMNACLDYNRMTVGFGVMGAARFCLETAIRYAKTRRQFGVPIAAKQLVQGRLADMATAVVLGESLALQLARRWEQAPLSPFQVSLCKRSNCAAALQVARAARAVLGAAGIELDGHVMRHLLNLEASYTYGGTDDIHALLLGRMLTGEAAF
jgi:glutaryl-CoA dehydrogenase